MRDSIDTIFCNAIEIAQPDARDQYVRQACGDDPQTRSRVEQLLAAHFRVEGILESPAPGLPPLAISRGSQIGRYRLVDVIGEGGMGVVYKAEQTEPVRRTVALKLIKLGMDTREVVARFRAEQQALASIDHEHVARVIDAGATDSGRPYFVMEYVLGESITACCDRLSLDQRRRLELFIQACEAVHHAHQKAILHRDLKPGNILVTVRDDGRPSVKIIDFGIAKALSGQPADGTMYTRHGQFVGTPAYMSPEQAGFGRIAEDDVDTRSDIYSLGVVLYELVTGMLPFDSKTATQEQDAPRPSTRLAALKPEEASRIALHRATNPSALLSQLRSELEWIPLKAIAQDRDERYRSAAELADDVRNYLERRPLIAGPRTARYRARKFLAKHARIVVAAAAVAVVVLALVVALALSNRRARRAQRLAQSEAVYANEQRRVAEILLAQATIEQAEALQSAGGVAAAWAGFEKGADAFERLGMSRRPGDVALLKSYDSHSPPVMVMEGHADGILSAALSPDGMHAITGCKDGTLKLWDVRTGGDVRSFVGHKGMVIGVAISPDGRQALSAGEDLTVRLWDVPSGRELRILGSHDAPARAVAFFPDGRRAISGSDDATARVWDLDSGRVIWTLSGHSGALRTVVVSDDGKLALTGSDGRRKPSLKLWDLTSGNEIRTIDAEAAHRGASSDNGIRAITFVPGNSFAITGGFDRVLKRWNLRANEPPVPIATEASAIIDVALMPDGRSALIGCDDGSVRLRDVSSGRELRRYHGSTEAIRDVAVSRDGRFVFAAGLDKKLRAWSASATRETTEASIDVPHSKTWFAWGHLVYVVELSGEAVLVFDTATGQLLRRVSTREPDVLELVNPREPPRFTRRDTADDVELSLWGAGESTLVRFPWDARRDSAVRLSPDGKLALFARDEGVLTMWDVASGGPAWELPSHSGRSEADFSPDGRRVITTDANFVIHLWDLQSRSKLCRIPFSGNVQYALSLDGRRLLTGNNAGLVQLWDIDGGGREIRRFVGHGAAIMRVQFRENGRTALTAGSDGILRLWDVETGQLAGSFDGTGRLLAWDLSEDGAALLLARQMPSGESAVNTFMLDRPPKTRRFVNERLPAARRALRANPDDPAALRTMGEWYAFRGLDETALSFFERARARDSSGPALPLARCYWRSNRPSDAAREFARAIGRKEAPEPYLHLCVAALNLGE